MIIKINEVIRKAIFSRNFITTWMATSIPMEEDRQMTPRMRNACDTWAAVAERNVENLVQILMFETFKKVSLRNESAVL